MKKHVKLFRVELIDAENGERRIHTIERDADTTLDQVKREQRCRMDRFIFVDAWEYKA